MKNIKKQAAVDLVHSRLFFNVCFCLVSSGSRNNSSICSSSICSCRNFRFNYCFNCFFYYFSFSRFACTGCERNHSGYERKC